MTALEFDPDWHLKHVLVVGIGGTGSQLARSISRILYAMQARNMTTPSLHLIDPDHVELKNVGRQMFAVADVGQPKAEVIAKRLSRALGIEVIWHNEPFDPTLIDSYRNTLLIGAVDNHAARQSLAKARSCVWLDCGNHFNAGQVVIGNVDAVPPVLRDVKRGERAKSDKHRRVGILPTAAALFPSLLEAEEQPQESCADLVARGEQHLLINDVIADVAANYVYKLLHRQPVRSFMTYVDLDGMNIRSVPISSKALKAFAPQPAAEARVG